MFQGATTADPSGTRRNRDNKQVKIPDYFITNCIYLNMSLLILLLEGWKKVKRSNIFSSEH